MPPPISMVLIVVSILSTVRRTCSCYCDRTIHVGVTTLGVKALTFTHNCAVRSRSAETRAQTASRLFIFIFKPSWIGYIESNKMHEIVKTQPQCSSCFMSLSRVNTGRCEPWERLKRWSFQSNWILKYPVALKYRLNVGSYCKRFLWLLQSICIPTTYGDPPLSLIALV
jgi:hypothetical protein